MIPEEGYMIKRLLHSKIFVLFMGMLLLGFFIGYSYSVKTSHPPQNISTSNGYRR